MDQDIQNKKKLMPAAILSGLTMSRGPLEKYTQSKLVAANFIDDYSNNQACSIAYRIGFSDADSSGVKLKKANQERGLIKPKEDKKTLEDGKLV